MFRVDLTRFIYRLKLRTK